MGAAGRLGVWGWAVVIMFMYQNFHGLAATWQKLCGSRANEAWQSAVPRRDHCKATVNLQ